MVCGSREWRDRGAVHLVLMCEPRQRGWDPTEPITIIHGAARGADTFADESARDLGYAVKAFPADWERHGRAAGPIRNVEMLKENPDLVIAFGQGRGTNHTVKEAEHRGIPVKRF